MKSFGKILCLCLGCTALVVPAHAQNNTIKLNLQQAIQAFTAKTGNAPTRIIVKAKETN